MYWTCNLHQFINHVLRDKSPMLGLMFNLDWQQTVHYWLIYNSPINAFPDDVVEWLFVVDV